MRVLHGKRPTGSSVREEESSTYLGLRSGWPSLQCAYRNMHTFGPLANGSGEVAGLRTRYVKSGTDY
jgi:hypothetical protein